MSDKSFGAKRTITFSVSVIAALSLFLAAGPIVTNQSRLTFDVNESPGMQSRTINTKEGEKEITKFAFVVWNPQIQQRQTLDLSNRWVRTALQAMVGYNTNSLVVSRKLRLRSV